MTAPLISVCIPVFNGEKYIRECISSVLSQSEQNFELLISDNCSTDQTLSICNEFTDPRIRILKSSSNIGSIENFNRCIQHSTGELFILLPCDDRLEEGCLKLLSQGFIDHPSVGIAFGSIIRIDDQGRQLSMSAVVLHDGMLGSEEAVRLIAARWDPLQHPMVRLNVVRQVSRFDPRHGSYCAIYLWFNVLFGGWDAYVVEKPVTAIRSHENQGQALFYQNTKSNLRKLRDHYGYSLPSDFYKENHSSLLFFRFFQFFNFHCRMFRTHNDLENLMIANLVRAHLGNLYSSLRHLNLSSCAAEITLSIKLMKVCGPVRMLRAYVSIVVATFIQKQEAFDRGAQN